MYILRIEHPDPNFESGRGAARRHAGRVGAGRGQNHDEPPGADR